MGYPLEQIVRFAASRFAAGKSYDVSAAARLGCADLLEHVKTEVARERTARDPKTHADLRLELQIELLAMGGDSPLAHQFGLSELEIEIQTEAARKVLAKLLKVEGFRSAMAGMLQTGLAAHAVRSVPALN